MWSKGELVWVNLNPSEHRWIPGRVLDPSEPFGVLVSFFDLMEPRYVPKPCLRSFERDFGTLVTVSWRSRRFVNRALQAHFWNVSFRLWCCCQTPIESPYLDREKSLPLSPDSPRTWDSALSFVREMAISLRVPLRRLAETNSSTAQILSFRRYTVDFNRSASVYGEIRESAMLMDRAEEPDEMDCVDLVSMFPEEEISTSCSSEEPVDKVVQICTGNTRKTLISSDSSVMRACGTMARTSSNHEEDAGHPLKNRERCQVEQSICLLNSKPPVEDIIEEDTSSVAASRVAVSEAPPDVIFETHDDDNIGTDGRTVTSAEQSSPLVDTSKHEAFLAKPISFAVLEACKNQACSVKETCSNPRRKFDSSLISANTQDEGRSDRNNNFNETRGNCSDDAVESHIVEVGGQVSLLHITGSSNKEFSADDVGIAHTEKLQDMEAATAVENQTRAVDNVESIGVKRKANLDKASSRNFKRKKKAGQQSISTDKPLNRQPLKDMRLADPKCLRMKFLSRHGNPPSKSELLKRFSVFGKIDASRTDVNIGESSGKVVFLQSIDAVTAYQFARSKKFKLGRCKVMYRLDAFEEDKVNIVPVSLKPQLSVPSPRSCLKKKDSVDKEEGRSHLKVRFQMATNS